MSGKDIHIGVNLGHHDSSVCALYPVGDGLMDYEILEEERLQRKKRIGFYPWLGLKKLQNKFDMGQIEANNVAFTTFMTTLEESFDFIDKSDSKYRRVFKYDPKLTSQNKDALNVPHHEAHLFSVLPQLENNKRYLVLVADGCGSSPEEFRKNTLLGPFAATAKERQFESISLYVVENGKVKTLDKLFKNIYLSEGTLEDYSPSAFFTACASKVFGHWSHAGKVMGLAGYHKGSLYSPDELFQKLVAMETPKNRGREEFDSLEEADLRECEKLCASTQSYFEKYMMDLLQIAASKANHPPALVYLGGCSLNCIFNDKLRRKKLFEEILVPGQPNDEGVGLGAAVASYYRKHGRVPKIKNPGNPFRGDRLERSSEAIAQAFSEYDCSELDLEKVAELIKSGEVIAWIQGRSECGPRALGHRSILCSPFVEGIKRYLNGHVKFREAFRPYGCSVLRSEQELYFEDAQGLDSPYMSFAPQVRETWRQKLAQITHIDGTLRLQSVGEEHGRFFDLLKTLKETSGCSMVVHTSLNVNKQPILENLEDAVKFFESSELRFLVCDDFFISKKN